MANGNRHLFEFGCFTLDASNRLLLRDGEPVPLQPKALDTLLLLIERRGEVLTKDELLRQLWPDSFVEESNLSQNIYVLRKTLSQMPGGGELIKTVPKRGYCFIANVREVSDNAELVVEEHTWTRILTEESESESIPEASSDSDAFEVITRGERGQKQLTRLLDLTNNWTSLSVQRLTLVALGFVVVLAVGAYVLWRSDLRNAKSETKLDARAPVFSNMKIQRLTDVDKVVHPAISPDGKYLAYVLRHEPDKDSIWIKHVPTGSAEQIVASVPDMDGYEAPTFSPDSSFIYYIAKQKGVNTLYRVAILGGMPRKVIDDVWGRIAVSPDGQHLAFVRVKWNQSEHAMLVANADGSGEQTLALRRPPEYFNVFGIGPSWSPDGTTIASSGGSSEGGNHDELILIDAKTGTQRLLPGRKWQSIGQVVWLPDNTGLLVPAKENSASPQQVWYISNSTGESHRITNDLNDYEMLSITADGKLLIAQQSEQVSNLWVRTTDGSPSQTRDAIGAVQITTAVGRREGFYGIAWTPDDRIVYASNTGGLYDLWIVNADGSNSHRLTESTGEANIFPTVSPDGRYIVFSSDRTGSNNIWRIDADGRNPIQLTHGINEYHSSFSSDGQWVFYESGQKFEVRKIPINGGDSVLVIGGPSSGHPVVSRDGSLVAYTYYDEQQKDPWRLGVMRLDGKVLMKSFPQPFRCFTWTPGTQSLTYIVGTNTISNLWQQSLDDKRPSQLTDFKEKRLYWFDWSPDGKYIALARGEWHSDVVTISDLR